MKVLFINAKELSYEIKEVDNFGPVDLGMSYPENFNFGIGKLCKFPLPGTHRLIFCNYSKTWDGIFISTLSGAAEQLYYAGIDAVSIYGKSDKLKILKIKDEECEFYDVNDINEIFNDKGFESLERYVFNKFSKDFENKRFRILAVGPAAMKTSIGAIGSTVIENGQFKEGVVSWAGRGGFGSKLVQEHGIVAVIFGGSKHENVWSRGIEDINKIFLDKFQKPMVKAVFEATTKYRYDDVFKSGGTFGVNMTNLKTWLTWLNWQSIYLTEDERAKLYEKLIKNHYLKQFNDEIIKPKHFMTCGERCVAVCKKMRGKHKKDYEPYQAAGCNSGIFDQRAAELLVSTIDNLGFDAIDAGNMVSFVMELLNKGLVKKEKLGLKSLPKFDLNNFDIEKDSMHNAELGVEIVKMFLENETFQHGLKYAAEKLNAKDLAIYNSHGKGSITPNMYWVPAFILPLPIQGKYLSDYSASFKEPYELGKSSAERMIKELYSDNTGICRFHRGWAEKIVEDLVNQLLGLNMNYYDFHKMLAKKIFEVNHKATKFWDSERVVDILKTYLEKVYECEKDNLNLKHWVERFKQDKWAAARQYWDDILRGFSDQLNK